MHSIVFLEHLEQLGNAMLQRVFALTQATQDFRRVDPPSFAFVRQ